MNKIRLDQELVKRGLVSTRSQAESFIKLGRIKVDGQVVTKPGLLTDDMSKLVLTGEQYVSRAGLKLASVAKALKLDFKNKTVLDVGSSTGGFTDYALQHGASKVIAVDVGTQQLHQSLRADKRIELHEKTDIRDFHTTEKVDIVVIDVSFISLRAILSNVAKLSSHETQVVAMAKPQFEAGLTSKHKGVIKNDKMRRNTLKELENWIQKLFIIVDKADSKIQGSKGNTERFYLLKLAK
ncbi:MAG TPA: TlyA family RNA methyltransferase [Patescibacteria group bacterium]|nr:TlyA family RNA methyltransferase [Patescibacteria group bacterium]